MKYLNKSVGKAKYANGKELMALRYYGGNKSR